MSRVKGWWSPPLFIGFRHAGTPSWHFLPIPLSRPIFNSEWIMSCKNILYVDSQCKSSYLCSRPFLSKSNLKMSHEATYYRFFCPRQMPPLLFCEIINTICTLFWKYHFPCQFWHIFRGLSHVKMYGILSSSGQFKVKQCAIERNSSLIWRWNQVCWEAILLDDILQLPHAAHEAASIFPQKQ